MDRIYRDNPNVSYKPNMLKPGFHKANYEPISSQNKAIRVKETAQPYNRFSFVLWSWYLPCNGNQV